MCDSIHGTVRGLQTSNMLKYACGTARWVRVKVVVAHEEEEEFYKLQTAKTV